MNNYVSTEKSLKRWLKTRVKVTMATVVGFLIAGTVAFGADGGETTEKLEYKIEVEKDGKYKVNGTAAETIANPFYGGQTALTEFMTDNTQESTRVTKEGTIVIIGDKGIPLEGTGTKLAVLPVAVSSLTKEGQVLTNVTNKADIHVKGNALGMIGAWGQKQEFVNDGKIYVDQNAVEGAKLAAAIGLDNGAGEGHNFTNNGEIHVKSGYGVYKLGDGTTTVTNKGKIIAEGEKATAIAVNGGKIENSGTIIGTNAIVSTSGNTEVDLTEGSHIEGEIKLSLEKTGDIININKVTGKDGAAEELQSITGVDKINVTGSNIVISSGKMETALYDGALLAINNSNLDINVDITGNGKKVGTSSLITNYGNEAKEYKLINRGNLISENAKNAIYTNASNGAKMLVENTGDITIGKEGWSNALNGKFDANSGSEITIVNTGKIAIKSGSAMDITNAGDNTNNANKGTLLNKGTIEVSGGVGIIATGAGVTGINENVITVNGEGSGLKASNGATVENKGIINLVPTPFSEKEGEIKLAYAILGKTDEEEGGTFINSADINVAAGTTLVKVEDLTGSSFINNAKVSVAKDGHLFIVPEINSATLRAEEEVFKITNDGVIELANDAVGGTGKVDFTNQSGAKLVLGEKATLGGEGSSFTNVGTAEFGKDAKISEKAEFEGNTGILKVNGVDFSKIGESLEGDELTVAQLKAIVGAIGGNEDSVSGITEDTLKGNMGIVTAYDEKGNQVVQIVGGNELEHGDDDAGIIFGDGNNGQAYKVIGKEIEITGGEASGKVLNIVSKDTPAAEEGQKPTEGSAGILKITDDTTLSNFVINIEDTELTKGSGIVLGAGVSGNNNVLTLKDSTVNADKTETAIKLDSYSTLKLDNTTVLGNIGNSNKGGVETAGKTTINGKVKVGRLTTDGNTIFEKAVTVGSAESNGITTNGTTWFKDAVTTTGGSFIKTNGTTLFDKEVTVAGALTTNGTTIFNGDLTTGTGKATVLGETFINKKLTLGADLTVGDGIVKKVATDATGTLMLDSKAEIVTGDTLKTITVEEDGKLVVKVGAEKDSFGRLTENALNNGEKFGTETQGIKLEGKGEVQFTTENFTGKDVIVAIDGVANDGADFEQISDDLKVTANSDIYVFDKALSDSVDGIVFTYDTELFEDGTLNNMNNQAYNVGSEYLSHNKAERADQLDRLYSSNIYAETVRASYDMFKLNEDTALSMNTAAKAGELVAEGKALYSKTEYDRDGILGDRTSENETTGLLANLVYGLDDNSSLGFVFSGAKQDIDTDGGSADGDAFYFGVYKDTTIGKAQVRTGAAYQLNKFDADNTAALKSTDASYDSNAYGVYSQATFTNDLGNGLSIQPKLRAGLTRIEQEAVKDAYFGLDEAEITTFDLTAGADLVKSVQLEKASAEFKLGAAYTYTMGDTDKDFRGSFKGGAESFDVLGAEIAENVFSINLGAEVSYESGFFYNGGFTYEFGSNETEAYGVTAGVGYKF